MPTFGVQVQNFFNPIFGKDTDAHLGLDDDEVADAIIFNAVDAARRNGHRVTRRHPPLLAVQGEDALATDKDPVLATLCVLL